MSEERLKSFVVSGFGVKLRKEGQLIGVKDKEGNKRLIYYGLTRVQYSLFRGYLRLRDKTMLEEEIRALVNAEDKVHIIELCEECKKRIGTIGDVPEVSPHLIL